MDRICSCRYLLHIYLIFLLSCFGFNSLAAEEHELNGTWGDSSVTDNLRYSVDLSSRAVFFNKRDRVGFQHAFGLDVHKVFSEQDGDIGTLNAQLYLTRLDNMPMHPGFFEDGNDWEPVFRIFNFNYTRFGGVIPNIRVGHFEIPFGLEHTIGTNGRLRDYNNARNLGLKADWGITLNDELSNFEYEVSTSMGTGQSLNRDENTYAYAGRIGTPRDDNLVLGLAVYKAKLMSGEKERIGIDIQWYFGLQGIFAEISTGQDGVQDVLNSQLEWNIRNSNEQWLIYLQLIRFSKESASGWDDNTSSVVGLLYEPDSHWNLSGQYKQELNTFDGVIREGTVSLQLRYRF